MGAGHMGIMGNEMADQLARNGASTPFIGPEPVLGITRGAFVLSEIGSGENMKSTR
uniref:RNase H domain-containing protein n=1 Tax=Rhodnius prolixus TaxID=13249 RepID=T1HN97_RHOPR